MSTSSQPKVAVSRLVLVWYVLAVALGVFTYFYGLESLHIPKNGDEYPYAHITHHTAVTGHWLPLASDYDDMRNTKPPLLFWQGIVSTDWAKNWSMWNLRYPSVIYTLLTALMAFLLAWKLSSRLDAGFVACLAFLAFFSTYRFGRPFLTSAPETFWFFLPFFVLLYWQPVMFESRLLTPLLLGVAVGIGLLYKSFALALPLGIGLSWWFFQHRRYQPATFLARDAWKIIVIIALALGIFSLWFLLDPNPATIWKEFVLKENVGKFDRKGSGYLATLLWGKGYSIWTMVLAYPVNAGLLLIPVVLLMIQAVKNRAEVPDAQRLLWLWVFTLFLVFCLPTQRSARYVLPAMPALAVLCALNWDRISRKAFVASLVVAGAVIALLAYLSIRLQVALPGPGPYSLPYWILLAGAGMLILAAIFVPSLTRATVCVGVLLVYFSFAAFMRPFDGLLGCYGAEVQEATRGKQIWVPLTWKGMAEEYRLLLPGADIQGYPYQQGLTIPELGARFPFFAIRLPMQDTNLPSGVKIVGRRLDFGSRHTAKQIKEMIEGQVFQHLFLQELLVEIPAASAASPQHPGDGEHQ
jgi:4-amino-4-deoxy-L-arabinose transferase-like glycosyltransferase